MTSSNMLATVLQICFDGLIKTITDSFVVCLIPAPFELGNDWSTDPASSVLEVPISWQYLKRYCGC